RRVLFRSNAAYAGEKGFTAWVERCDSFEDVKDYLKSGVPVVASIRTAKDDPLPGAVMPYPAGHLLVITGLTEEDGQRLVLVNDQIGRASCRARVSTSVAAVHLKHR